MKKSFILLNKTSFIYEGRKYDIGDIESIAYEIKNSVVVIICGEEVYTKHFFINNKTKRIRDFINHKIKNESMKNDDILYDYEEADKTAAGIYSIRGADKITALEEVCENMEVKPIQVIIRTIIHDILGDKYLNIRVILKFEGYFYYISLRRGLFYYCFAEENLNVLLQRIIKVHDGKLVYCDEKIKNNESLKKHFKIIIIKIEEYIYEKLYEKQKFYIRKVL